MQFLSVADYDRAERTAAADTPTNILRFTRPVTFNATGFPTHVDDVRDLRRYIEVFQEQRFDRHLDVLGGSLSADEFALTKTVCGLVTRLSAPWTAQASAPSCSLLSALINYRRIRALYPSPGATIFEIGPGNGYLGALLALSGYRHISTDVTQALYLYQSHLSQLVASELSCEFIELATDPRSLSDIGAPGFGAPIAHVPWWKFYLARPDFDVTVDCVVANQVLAEMQTRALRYSLKVAHRFLTQRATPPESAGHSAKCFVTDGWGMANPAGSSGAEVAATLRAVGFTVVFDDLSGSVLLDTDNATPELRRMIKDRLAQADQNSDPTHAVRRDEISRFFKDATGRDDLLTDDEHFLNFTDMKIDLEPDRIDEASSLLNLMRAKGLAP